MARYGTTMQRTASTTQSLGDITAAAASPRRAKIYYISFGSESTPADNAILFHVQACSAPGTGGSAVTPTTLDPGDSIASTILVGQARTAEPTYTGSALILEPINQKTSWKWYAPDKGELIIPATTTDGYGFKTPTINTGTPLITSTVHFEEL